MPRGSPGSTPGMAADKCIMGLFTRYDFVACDKRTTGLRHELFRVNQTYNSLTTLKSCRRPVVSLSHATKSCRVNRPYETSVRLLWINSRQGRAFLYFAFHQSRNDGDTSFFSLVHIKMRLRMRSFEKIRIRICDRRSHRSRCMKGTEFKTSSQRIPKSTLF